MISQRKDDHLNLCVNEEVECGDPGFDDVRLKHSCLPEVSFNEINTETRFLDRNLDFPFIIEAITGGTKRSGKINRDLAKVADEHGLGFGVGSQRIAIENPKLAETFKVRGVAPDVFLIANLGAVQLNYGFKAKQYQEAVDMIEADALAIHVNPLQEVLQPEGNKNFQNLGEKIDGLRDEINVPIILKGVGSGLNACEVVDLNVDAFDVGGAGGTSWGLIESRRSGRFRSVYGDWGIPTVECLRRFRDCGKPVIASGGVRSGLDVAKSLALGADAAGAALPILSAWSNKGVEGVECWIQNLVEDFKVAIFLTSSRNTRQLRDKLCD
ncbi:MAG: type 2 isopentenyl-diphosphate Delta-isomerase [Candidatus Altiarchaeales archaeon]|nr:type 2 isopentenyl-diphosphate Delta-isomerase [Candidatus Altiarchaeales archaeon]